jgi:hypothetical protein
VPLRKQQTKIAQLRRTQYTSIIHGVDHKAPCEHLAPGTKAKQIHADEKNFTTMT